MNQTLESIKIFFFFNKKPIWKVFNIDTKTNGPSNETLEDLDQSWNQFTIAYNTFLHNGNFRLVVKNNVNTADSKGNELLFTKNVGFQGVAGIGSMGTMGFSEQMMMWQMMQQQSGINGITPAATEKIERLQDDIKKLEKELLEAKFNSQIESLKRDQKDKEKKKGIGEALIPLAEKIAEKHLPALLAFAGGQMSPRAAVGLADSTQSIPNPQQQESKIDAPTEKLEKVDVLTQPGFHNHTHAFAMLDLLEDVLPEYNINCVLQNLVVVAQNDPESFKLLIQSYLC